MKRFVFYLIVIFIALSAISFADDDYFGFDNTVQKDSKTTTDYSEMDNTQLDKEAENNPDSVRSYFKDNPEKRNEYLFNSKKGFSASVDELYGDDQATKNEVFAESVTSGNSAEVAKHLKEHPEDSDEFFSDANNFDSDKNSDNLEGTLGKLYPNDREEQSRILTNLGKDSEQKERLGNAYGSTSLIANNIDSFKDYLSSNYEIDDLELENVNGVI